MHMVRHDNELMQPNILANARGIVPFVPNDKAAFIQSDDTVVYLTEPWLSIFGDDGKEIIS